MKVQIARGTRDAMPETMLQRQRVVDIIRGVYQAHGFNPLATPAFERIETLMGKYGDEGDQLIYRILKRGEGGKRGEVDLALRYDLTVPLARVVAMNPSLRMPFKRYQIQQVWRADKPQHGRFREFTQCDIDVVGCEDPIADAEVLTAVDRALRALGLSDFTIQINHRALLRAMVEAIGAGDRETSVLVGLDKLDKIGWDGVRAELGRTAGLNEGQVDQLQDLVSVSGPEGLDALSKLGPAVDELRQVLELADALGLAPGAAVFSPTLARGLSYYTGPVFEVVSNQARIGSITGGGRYDGLVGMFGKTQVPAVGASLGLERILVVLEELGLLDGPKTVVQVLVTLFDTDSRPAALATVRALREAGVSTDLWVKRPGKLGKQFKHADQAGIPWVLIQGPEEAQSGVVKLKHLASGEQWTGPLADAITRLRA